MRKLTIEELSQAGLEIKRYFTFKISKCLIIVLASRFRKICGGSFGFNLPGHTEMCTHSHTYAYMIWVSQAQGILNLKSYEDEKGASVKSDKLVDQIRGRAVYACTQEL